MLKVTKKNLPASVHSRLLNLARDAERPLNEFLHFYAIERFHYRLGQTLFRKKFILKGANAPLLARADFPPADGC
ncbi:MAG TPA: hypothetical protein VNI84_12065 [Pyrinomonadaceae bacterium]|nr:hypothetical protein [Pyrinomonadaceae bacterium]